MIAKCWDADYKKYTEALVYDGKNTHEITKVISTFGFGLKSQAWLPARDMDGYCYNDRESGKLVPLLKGSELYQNSEPNKQLLHNHVPYIGADLRSYDFMHFLQVQETVSPSTLLSYLIRWSEAGCFESSIDHMRQVYIKLSNSIDDEIKQAFSCNGASLIFIPSTTQRNQHVVTSGRFVSIHGACWKDETTILFQRAYKNEDIPPHLPQILSAYYNSNDAVLKDSIKHAFRQLGIENKLKLKVLVDLLDFNASLSPTPTKSLIDDFRNIAQVVVDTVTNEEVDNYNYLKAYFCNNIKSMEVFPSVSGKWVTLNGLYIDDDSEISRHFADHDQVNFLKWPSSEDTRRQHYNTLPNRFTELCEISQLSRCVTSAIEPGGKVQLYPEFQRVLHHLLPLVQCYVATYITTDWDYHDFVCNYVQRLTAYSVLELICVYSIDDKYFAPQISIHSCQLKNDDPPLVYVVLREDGKITDRTSLVDVLIKALIPPEKAENRKVQQFVQHLIMDEPRTDQDKDEIWKRFQLKPLPDNLPIWHKDIPAHLRKDESSESETEDEEEEYDKELPQEEAMSVDEPSEGLTSWPPKAPLGLDTKKTSRQRQSKTTQPPHDSDDIITLKDIQKSHQQQASTSSHMQKSDSVSEPEKETSQALNRQVSSDSSKETSLEQRRPSLDRASHSQTTSVDGRQIPVVVSERIGKPLAGTKHRHGSFDPHASTGESVREAKEPRVEEESVDEESHLLVTKDPVNKGTTGSRQQTPASKVQYPKPKNYTDLVTVDVSHFMQPVDVTDNFKAAPTASADGKEQLMAVGRWGEWFVCQWLQHEAQLPSGETIVKVEWLNEDEESGEPCDIKVATETGEFFIEVKSTQTSEKALVPISWRELSFAREKKQCYILFRVYNVPRLRDVKLMWLQDLFQHIENPTVKLYVSL